MTEIGDSGIFRDVNGRTVFVPARRPEVGDTCILYPVAGGYVAVPLTAPEVGDTVLLEPINGRYVAVPPHAFTIVGPTWLPTPRDHMHPSITSGFISHIEDDGNTPYNKFEAVVTAIPSGATTNYLNAGPAWEVPLDGGRYLAYTGYYDKYVQIRDLLNGGALKTLYTDPGNGVGPVEINEGRILFLVRGTPSTIYRCDVGEWDEAWPVTVVTTDTDQNTQAISLCGDIICSRQANTSMAVHRLSTGARIFTDPTYPTEPHTNGTHVVWARGLNGGIFLYTVATGTVTQLSTDSLSWYRAASAGPDLDGTTVVWSPSPGTSIKKKDIITGIESVIYTTTSKIGEVAIKGDIIAWTEIAPASGLYQTKYMLGGW